MVAWTGGHGRGSVSRATICTTGSHTYTYSYFLESVTQILSLHVHRATLTQPTQLSR